MAIADAFYPDWENLVVVPDKVSDVIGVGIDGAAITAADRYKEKPRTGRVLAAGPLATYSPGQRVIFDVHSVTEMAQDGTSERLYLIMSSAIRCWVDDGADASDLMGEQWKDHIKPPPGCLVVERAAMPLHRGRIIVPDGISLATRSSEAVVLASADELGEDGGNKYERGDRVFLAGTTTKFISLGRRGDVSIWIIRPREIAGRLLDDPGGIVEVEDSPERGLDHLAELADRTFGLEEGDTRAPR